MMPQRQFNRGLFAAAIAWLLTTGCSSGPELPPPETTAQLASTTAEAGPQPEWIALRVLVVAYQGATAAGPTERTQAQALERARMLSTMAKQGEKLSDLITDYSDRPNADEDRGLIKLRPAEPAPYSPEAARAALDLRVGGVSDPLEGPGGYIVFERMPDPPPGPERIGARHILIVYVGSAASVETVTRTQPEALALAEQVAKLAQAPDADWAALAAQYTEEPGGKERAGDLGKFGRGQMVPAFERAAFALPVGKISGVVESQFGYHIIQRYE
jgi:PPIC-type PPIASE domain